MTLSGYKNSYENVELFSENQHILPKKLKINNFLNVLDIKYPNIHGELNIHIIESEMLEASFQIIFKYGFEELLHRSKVVVYLVPEHFVYNEFGEAEELYEIATYQAGKPNYSHYFTKDEIDTIEKFCDHVARCAVELIVELPF
jgi:hypothetical protein